MEGKQKRKPNWTSDESLALASLVDDYKHMLRGKLSPSVTSDMKTRAWGEVSQKLCAMGVGPSRTPAEVEKKWHNIFSNSKSEISSYRRTVSGTGQSVIVLHSAINLIGYIKLTVDLTYVPNFFFYPLSSIFVRMINNHKCIPKCLISIVTFANIFPYITRFV